MRTALLLLAGFLLLASVLIVGKLLPANYPAATGWGTAGFIALWLVVTAADIWVGDSTRRATRRRRNCRYCCSCSACPRWSPSCSNGNSSDRGGAVSETAIAAAARIPSSAARLRRPTRHVQGTGGVRHGVHGKPPCR